VIGLVAAALLGIAVFLVVDEATEASEGLAVVLGALTFVLCLWQAGVLGGSVRWPRR
jgi:hypothetical protein